MNLACKIHTAFLVFGILFPAPLAADEEECELPCMGGVFFVAPMTDSCTPLFLFPCTPMVGAYVILDSDCPEADQDPFEYSRVTWSLAGPALGLKIVGAETEITWGSSAAIVPAGSPEAVESGSLTVIATDANGLILTGNISVQVVHEDEGCRGSTCQAAAEFAQTSTGNRSVSTAFKLGRGAFGKSAGALSIKENNPISALCTPACLKYLYPTNYDCEVITNANGIRQAKIPEGLANIVTNTAYKYSVEFYPASAIGTKSNGLYQLSGAPLSTTTVENPDTTGNTTNRLRVTDGDGSVSDYAWQTNGWYLTNGGGMRTIYKNVTTDSNVVRTSTVEIRGETNGLVACTIKKYQAITIGTNYLTNVVEAATGDGSAARTNTYTYYTNSPIAGVKKEELMADGYWQIHRYETNTCLAFLNQAPTTNGSLCRTIDYGYGTNAIPGAGDKGRRQLTMPRRTVESLLGYEISRSYLVVLRHERREIRCVTPGAAWTNADNLVTTRRYYTNGPNDRKLWSIERPDGTMEIFDYITSANRTKIVLTGAPDAAKTNVVDGTKTITVVGPVGQMVSRTVVDIASGITVASEVYTNYDSYNRPRKITYLDGTSTLTDHGCCGPITETNREGTVINYYQDALKRRSATKKNDLTITNVFDAAGRTINRIRIGSDSSRITNHLATYDSGGRLLTSKDALGNVTTYSETVTNNQLVRTTTYPDGSTRIEEHYRDGQLAKVTGTAVHPVRYEYGVVQDASVWRRYTKEIKLDGNGNDTSEAVTNFFDMLGRNYKTVHADGAKQESFYNSKGQLAKTVDPDGVATLYQYNARGELEYTAIDMNRDGTNNLAGTDRIRQTVRVVTTKGASNVVQTKTYVWATNNSAISNLVSVLETKTDGLISWNANYGATNQSRTAYTGSGNRYVTNTAPDGSYSVSHFQHGQLTSVTRKDPGGTQLSQTTYTYDTHGRQKTAVDARNGTTTYSYDNADRRASVTMPAPGTGQNPQTTTFAYDYAGRITRTGLPDGGGITNTYSMRGELLTNFGTRTYPVAYAYDAQGRRTNMVTWTNFAGASGAAATKWKFDSQRGFITNKVYADGNGPKYTYTPSGRLKTRTWARGTITTYETNSAGEVVVTTYSDGTPGVTNGLDRLGRKTNIMDGAGTHYLTYTDSGLLLMETNASGTLIGMSITNGYDSVLRRTTLAVRSNATTLFTHSYAYDSASRLTNVSDGTHKATYSYLANSPLVSDITFRSNSTTRMTTTKSHDYLNRLLASSSLPSASGQSAISYAYVYNDASQRTRVSMADGSYRLYEYDNLGQLISGKHYWSDGTPVAGQQHEYAYDDIGNRQSTKAGGNEVGAGLRTASYSANNLNQYTQRDVPGAADIIGIAHGNATVTVNDASTYRKGEYYWKELSISNASTAVWQSVTNIASLTGRECPRRS